ncbi:hypothetical protein ACJMK2_019462 [Sinanodonta woodiana]|uniref:ShKT domain-containing protein n=1 Tax=Sinanodonta woodiana TaxID=1069815 RepID=A0ABD3UGG2_SINWO
MFSLLVLASLGMVAYGENSCKDILQNCQNLADVYCKEPYDKLAADVCAKRCELCPESSDRIEKRSHGQPGWIDHCWDMGENHLRDPFCALLTTTVPTTPTTQSTAIPTTPRTCYYIEYNETDIKATDYANEILPNNATLNESVHLFGDSSYCKTVCEQSLLNDGYECWGFSYSPTERCHLYYYDKPIYIIQFSMTGESNNTSLFLKRCNNDPSTPVPETTLPTITTTPKATTTIATTTQRYCDYEIYNSTSITATDFGSVTQTVNGQNVTVNETVRVAKEEAECKTICEASILNDGYECWAFSFNSVVKCYLYYYSRPITIIDVPMIGNKTDTTLYLKRCSDDRVRFGGTTLSTAGTLPPGVPATHSPFAFNEGPDGIKVVNGSSFTITGTPTNGSVCFFNNHSYALGDMWMWDDGCQFQCECTNTTNNIASCTDQCPHYTNYPSSCALIKTSPAACCYTLNCTDMNNNTTNGKYNHTDERLIRNCTNKIDTCDYYLKSACSGVYLPWAKANCELRCNLCDDGTRESCYDAYSFCERFGPTLCTDYLGYARKNCRKFCNLCDS